MKLKIGDKVRFLNDVGGGRITSIINDNLVNVETEDGFDVPTQTNNLIVVNVADDYEKKGGAQKPVPSSRPAAASEKREPKPEDPWFSDKNQNSAKEEIQFLFALVPQIPANPPAGEISMYLINNCNDTLLYRFAKKNKYNYETVAAGSLNPNTKLFLGLIKPEMIAELPAFCFQLLHFKKRGAQLEPMIQKEITLSAVKFYRQGSFISTKLFKAPIMVFQLNEDPLRAEMEKLAKKQIKEVVATKEPAKKEQKLTLPNSEMAEIDLHIHELLDNFNNLTNSEMLKVQMDKFQEEMNKAIKEKIKKIVFIHGVGNGTLKNELRRELQRKYSQYNFQDASFREYGYGATMVILHK